MLLREIAKREEISEKYSSNLVNPLKSMGLVEATRGVHGGYTLGKEPSGITMKEIVEALEGSLLPGGLCRKIRHLRPCRPLRRPRSVERGGAGDRTNSGEIHPGRYGHAAKSETGERHS